MKDVVSKVINNLNCCNAYCCRILNKPAGVYSIESVVMAEVIKDYIKECLRLLKDE